MNRKFFLIALVCFGGMVLGCRKTETESKADKDPEPKETKEGKAVPEGFQQLMARGGLPSIDNPKYVGADEANIDDKSFVFGVVIEGQPFAYSLTLLNNHEVVNDTVGETNFAAVW